MEFFSSKYVSQYYMICGWLKPRRVDCKLHTIFNCSWEKRGEHPLTPALFKGKFHLLSNWNFCFFYCCVLEVLYIFQLIVVKYVVGVYFVPVCTLYFHLLCRVFGRAKVLKFVGIHLISFSFYGLFLLSSPGTVHLAPVF